MDNKKRMIFLVALFMVLSGVAAFGGTVLGSFLANNRNNKNNKNDDVISDEIDDTDNKYNEDFSNKVSLYSILEKNAVLSTESSEYVSSINGIDYSKGSSDTNGKGLYSLPLDNNFEFPVLYFRGAVDNNNVIFADFCWKIVRTTETGGVKLIYNGKTVNGKCPGNTYSIGQTSFNDKQNGELFLGGYMYESVYEDVEYKLNNSSNYIYGNDVVYVNNVYKLKDTYISKSGYEVDQKEINSKYHYTCFSTKDTCSVVYYIRYPDYNDSPLAIKLEKGRKINNIINSSLKASRDSFNSNVKTYIDSWYKNNLLDYEKYLEDSIWCNDRSVDTLGVYDKDSNYTLLYFGYSSREHLKEIDLSCPNINDSFTVNNSLGNMKLTYPIGLLTADEIKLAGVDDDIKDNYLYTEDPWWTMTPKRQIGKSLDVMAAVHFNGLAGVGDKLAVRPSITLKKGIMVSNGNGTVNNPYIIEK